METGIKLGPPTIKLHGPLGGKLGDVSVRVSLLMPTNIEVEFEHSGRRTYHLMAGDWDFYEMKTPKDLYRPVVARMG